MTKKKTTDDFKLEVYEQVGDEYTVLGEYIGAKDKIHMRHDKCNWEYNVTPTAFLYGARCPKCANKIQNTDIYKERIFMRYGNEYTILGEYKTAKTPVLTRHNVCGTEWEVRPDNLVNSGFGCPTCAKSKAEKYISALLKEKGIYFSEQYIFPDCKNIEPLRFDFAIFDNVDKTKLRCVVEYDGVFHFLNVVGEKHLQYQQTLDEIKNKYCKENNIKLIRIPYWDFKNIPNVVEDITMLNKDDI
jgi:hypothetical protein